MGSCPTRSLLLAVHVLQDCRACSAEVDIVTTGLLHFTILSSLLPVSTIPLATPFLREVTRKPISPTEHLAPSELPCTRQNHLLHITSPQHHWIPANLAVFDYFPTPPSVFRLKRQQSHSSPSYYNTNTAKLTSTLLQRTGLTFAEGVKPSPAATAKSTSPSRLAGSSAGAMGRVPSRGEGTAETQTQPAVVQSAERKMSYPPAANKDKVKRRRRSSSLMYQEPPESLEQQSDQAVLPNLNAQWVNAKGM